MENIYNNSIENYAFGLYLIDELKNSMEDYTGSPNEINLLTSSENIVHDIRNNWNQLSTEQHRNYIRRAREYYDEL